MYTQEQIEYIKDQLSDYIWYFGYAEHVGNDRTGFFKYETPTSEQIGKYRGFRSDNEKAIKFCAASQGHFSSDYLINGGVPGVDVGRTFAKEDMARFQYPAVDFAHKRQGFGPAYLTQCEAFVE